MRLHGSTWCARGTGPISSRCGGALSSPLKEFRHAATAEGSRGIRRNLLPNQPPSAQFPHRLRLPKSPQGLRGTATTFQPRFAAAANSLRTTPLVHCVTGSTRHWSTTPLTSLAGWSPGKCRAAPQRTNDRHNSWLATPNSSRQPRDDWPGKPPSRQLLFCPPKMPRLPVQSEPAVMTRPRRSSAEMPQLGTDSLAPRFASESNHTSA